MSPRAFTRRQEEITEENTSKSEVSSYENSPKNIKPNSVRNSEKVKHLLRSCGSTSSASSDDSEIVDPR